MTKQLEEALDKARKCFAGDDFTGAFAGLRAAAGLCRQPQGIVPRIDSLENEYYYMLRFISAGNDVADIETTISAMAAKGEEIARSIELEDIAANDSTAFSGQLRYMRLRPEENLQSLVSDYLAEADRISNDTGAFTDTRRRASLERISSDIFNRLWVEFPLSTDDITLIQSILADSTIPLYDRVMWTHAIGLSALGYSYDGILTLLVSIMKQDEPQLSTAASIWLILCAAKITTTEDDYDTAEEKAIRLVQHVADSNRQDVVDILTEYCRALGAEGLSNDFKASIGRDLQDLSRKVQDSIAGMDSEKVEEAMMNPEWLGSEIGSGGFDALHDFAKAQAAGDDVFMATLGKMRSFEFFNTLSNWFLPFHTAHSMLAPVVDGEGAMVADTIAQMPVLCDSDKYAVVLSMTQMPEGMRQSAMTQMTQQFQAMMSSPEAEAAFGSEGEPSRRFIINNHMKNISRFFKYYSRRNEFFDIFKPEIEIGVLSRSLLDDIDDVLAIADELFRLKQYCQTLGVYNELIFVPGELNPCNDDFSAATLAKIAFTAEMTGDYSLAFNQYKKAIKRNPADLQSVVRLVHCSLRVEPGLSDKDLARKKALEILEPALAANSDSTELLRAAGALYGRLDRWDDALDAYHNLDYLLPSDDSSTKPLIARALLNTGDWTAALEIYESLPSPLRNSREYALALWMGRRREEALSVLDKLPDDIRATGWQLSEALYKLDAAKSFLFAEDMLHYRHSGRQI